ncbi:putative S-adenosyl-L-methionine-dependent methyltransferase [Seiridium unicorne]|uniref:S-adenosyl-L-methionine-dependent methyltransferase n=1 Tax=Seiridium unicorne TaxID=138068 RepID=A0ABR2UJF4_9PEZI
MNPYSSTEAREGGKSLQGLGAKSVIYQQHDTQTPGSEHSVNISSSLSLDSTSPRVNLSTPAVWSDVPLLPSQLLESYKVAPAPSHLFTERVPVALKSEPEPAVDEFWFQEAPGQRDLSFSTVANEMINKSLGRQPGGTSVVEPDSILGESGRLYHGYKDGKYLLPNDAAEQDRLDLQHAIWRLVLDGWLALAPLTTPPKFVLDIGTGTGIWANEFAEQNPSSYVIGTDLSAIQPNPAVPNCSFIKDDAEEKWCFPHPDPDHATPGSDGNSQRWISFDYVHLRMMLTCFDDTRVVIGQAFDNMTPGGWVEFQDTAFEFFQANKSFAGNAIMRWAEGCNRGMEAIGRDGMKVYKYKGWLEDAGFTDVVHRHVWTPVSPWAEDRKFRNIGAWSQSNLYDGAKGIGWRLLKAAGMGPEQIEHLIVEVRRELRLRDNNVYGLCHVVYGRKPFSEGE